jgi:hypothetical protein
VTRECGGLCHIGIRETKFTYRDGTVSFRGMGFMVGGKEPSARSEAQPVPPFPARPVASQPAAAVRVVPIESASGERLYQQLKQLEGQIPIPEPRGTVLVGTLDAASGAFDWGDRVSIRRERERVGPGDTGREAGRGTVVEVQHVVSLNVVNVDLAFAVQNRQTDAEVTVNGSTTSIPAGERQVVVPVGRADLVDFTIRSGNVSHNDRLVIERFAVGAGAITIDALPIALVYCPLQGTARNNVVTYQQLESVGTRQELSSLQEDSEVDFDFVGGKELGERLEKLGPIATGINPVFGASLGKVAELISALGSEVDRFETSTQIAAGNGVENSTVRGELLTTPLGAGPGVGGEQFVVLRHVKAAWLAHNGVLFLAIISTPIWSAPTTATLQADLEELDARRAPSDEQGSRTLLTAPTIRALLALNPFLVARNVPVRPVSLREPRFRLADDPHTYELPPGAARQLQLKFEATVEESDSNSRTNTIATIKDMRKGFLSFLGGGPSEDKTITVRSSLTNLTRRTTGLVVSMTVTVSVQQDEPFRITAYYDDVFGTFAFLPADQPSLPESRSTGRGRRSSD